MKNLCFFLLALLFAGTTFAQSDVYLNINHKLGTSPFQFNTQAMNNNNVVFNVNRLQYYVSKVIIVHDGGMETPVSNKWFLVNAGTAANLFLGNFSVTNLEGVKFGIGVESTANHLDPSSYPSTHPLAPQSPSMHWGWSAGYRFVAMEGKGGSSLNQTFEIHALEDNNYFETTVMTTGTTSGQDIVIDLDADYAMAIRNIDVSAGVFNHGGTGEAVTLLENFRDYVFTPAGTVVGLEDEVAGAGFEMGIAPNPSAAAQQVVVSGDLPAGTQLTVTDLAGRVVLKTSFSEQQLAVDVPGYYLVSAHLDGKVLASKKLLITQ